MPEKAYVRYAWILIALIGAFQLLFGAALIAAGPALMDDATVQLEDGETWADIQGTTGEQRLIEYLVFVFAGAAVFLGLFTVALAAGPFREGQVWAWQILWLSPAALLLSGFGAAAEGVTSVAGYDLSEAAILIVGLLLGYRKVYPRLG